MARGTGTANLAASLEVLAGAPLDARTVVPTVADLTIAANFPYKYIGLPVVVQATGDLYILTGNDVTVAANWKKVGDGGSSGGSDNVIEGYYNSLDYLFYEEVTYDTPIAGASEVIYVAVDTDKTYRYDGQIFVRLDEERDTGSDNVVEGYYNTEDQLFYEESTYTTAISGESEVIYVALDTNKTYRYNGSIFVRLDEESGGGGSGGHTIVDESGTEMTQEDKLQFTSGLKVTDDSENASTKVEADLMAAADMDEIIPELPGVMARSIYNNRFNRSDLYSTDEVLIGKWTDGKPLYQKTIITENSTKGTAVNINVSSLNIDTCVAVRGTWIRHNTEAGDLTYEFNEYEGNSYLSWIRYKKSITSIQYLISLPDANDSTTKQFITFQYTKTTDSVCNVNFDKDYSTDETLVGRWIDGKPIYQQTIVLPSKITLSANTWLVTSVSSATKEQIINVIGHRTVEHGGLYVSLVGNTNGGNGLEIKSGVSCDLEMITVQYTKTTD